MKKNSVNARATNIRKAKRAKRAANKRAFVRNAPAKRVGELKCLLDANDRGLDDINLSIQEVNKIHWLLRMIPRAFKVI
jgi:hypothetical protein